ncbi:MAG TPA: M20/M25/M40 family metallo-hydrolase [Actinomycetota bacterium]|jgi:acetylornithine deacetylase/succinyl-diaminopimelate desuccinylase-like protein|nr:M20/M25/M40 family metallo-hydrolase [Actinomycetota bacterium]
MAQDKGSRIIASSSRSESVKLLRDLLRVRSINPPGDEAGVAELLETYLAGAGLETKIVTSPEGRSSLIARLDGPQDRPALVLLSHSDVVPVEENNWSRDPFGGELAEGFIWGRGALDMKSVAVMHAVALAELARSGQTPSREVIVASTADEEAGGGEGARWVLDEHAELVGFGDARPAPEVISEGAYGLAGMLDRPVIPIATGEKTAVFFDVVAEGDPGHGALPPQRQAPVNLAVLIEQIAGFATPRVHPVLREQFSTLSGAASGATAAIFRALASPMGGTVARALAPRLRKAGALGLLLADSTTPTRLSAGYKSNVVPAEARASFDSRLLPDTDVDEYISSVDTKARRHGGRVTNIDNKGFGPVSSKGPLFEILKQASEELAPGAVTTDSLSPGITDLRFFRARGANGYGWIPLVLTPELLATIHGHDERVGIDDFEQAITVMSEVVHRAAT